MAAWLAFAIVQSMQRSVSLTCGKRCSTSRLTENNSTHLRGSVETKSTGHLPLWTHNEKTNQLSLSRLAAVLGLGAGTQSIED
jgi:hypothetical protein